MNNSAIKVSEISKCFSVRPERKKNSRSSFLRYTADLLSPKTKELWALKNISFEIMEGETVGIIGMNGAGKSTLLKILSDIICPSSGIVEISGKLAAILDIGVGLHPELSGRDNISLYGKMLGFSKSQIDLKFDEIVEFSGIHDFIDTPVKLYSSGMLMRLGFSVIASLEADIILLDEILAVGDILFRSKCVNKIIELKNKRKTIVIVGHDLNEISNYCDRLIILHHGEIIATGEPQKIINQFNQILLREKFKNLQNQTLYLKKDLNVLYQQSNEGLRTSLKFSADSISLNSSTFEVHSAAVTSDQIPESEADGFIPDESLSINISLKYLGGKGDIAFIIRDIMNHNMFGDFLFNGHSTLLSETGFFSFRWKIPPGTFNEGIFKVGLVLFDEEYHSLFNLPEALIFKISSSKSNARNFGFYAPFSSPVELIVNRDADQNV